MDAAVAIVSPEGIEECDRRQALLAEATATIDRIAEARTSASALGEFLDWLAHFTREHYGFQQRLLNECSRHREYVFSRIAAHAEFRRRLSQICIDMLRRDASVPERLRVLCHEMLADAEKHDRILSELIRSGTTMPRLRRARRREELAVANRVPSGSAAAKETTAEPATA